MSSRKRRTGHRLRLLFEPMERRELLSAAVWSTRPDRLPAQTTYSVRRGSHGVISHGTSPVGNGFNATQIRHAYGMDQISFGNVLGDGTGQTIAIIDAYHYPTALADLQTFDAAMGLPDPPSFQQVAQDGSQNFPATDPNGGAGKNSWELEEALDLQWAHAMAPGANLILVEANSTSFADLVQGAVAWARAQLTVSVISMSFGSSGEFSTETSYDSYFTTPAGHIGVTFVASTGDAGKPGGYPAYSPGVVAVGGTSLVLSGNEYLSESGWSGSGGGISLYENKPSYQSSVTLSSTKRTIPDVSFVADPNTGVAVCDSFDFSGSPWIQIGGTSLAAPMFAGLLAVTNQGRKLAGKATLNGTTDTLPKLYAANNADFHDITSGNNGFAAGPGYDLVTGIGSPVPNLLVGDLVGIVSSIGGHVYSDNNGDGAYNAGDTPLAGVTVFLDANNNGILDLAGNQTKTNSTAFPIPDSSTVGAASPITVSGLSSVISSITLTLNITHQRDSNLVATLIAPDGTQVILFTGVGGRNPNFTNTTLSDSATTSINSGTAPFSGTYAPASALAAFAGKSANGTWKLLIQDLTFRNTGNLNSWSITINTAGESFQATGSDGSYSFTPLSGGNYNVREVLPSGFQATGAPTASFNLSNTPATVNFTNMPVAFTSAGPSDIFNVWLSGSSLNIGKTGENVNPVYTLPLASLSTIHFQLTSANTQLIIDYSGGDPVPAAGIVVDGAGLSTAQLVVYAAGQTLTMTDSAIGLADGNLIQFTNLGTMTIHDATVHYIGTFSTLQAFNILDSTFYWDG